MAKPNRWVDFIRKWAKDNDTSYSCALSNPKCKDAYRAKYGVRKAVPAKTERERMGLEDINREDRPLGFKRRADGVLISDKTAKERKKSFKAQVEEVIAEAKAKPTKKGYKLYTIEYKGAKGQPKSANYFVENSREGLSFKDRKVYDSGLQTDGYIYKFHPLNPKEKIDLTHLPAGSFLGTLEQAPEIANIVKGKPDKKKKLRIVEDEFVLPEAVKGAMVVAEPPKKKHKRRPPVVDSDPTEDNFRMWMKAADDERNRQIASGEKGYFNPNPRGGGSFYRL